LTLFIGIDDTDNLESRGTGFQARSLGMSLQQAGLFKLHSITRHQLLADRRIPFTSHNSSACLNGEAFGTLHEIETHCGEFLVAHSAHDSDAGLCLAFPDQVTPAIQNFGERAKKEILAMEEAQSLAREAGIILEGFLNTRLGIIGSLAAVGLRSCCHDGRLLWTKNLRESTGIFNAAQYCNHTDIERIIEIDRSPVHLNASILVHEWSRPVMYKGSITLFVEKSVENELYHYQSASKEFIKSISE
jgi:hypothetical protein